MGIATSGHGNHGNHGNITHLEQELEEALNYPWLFPVKTSGPT